MPRVHARAFPRSHGGETAVSLMTDQSALMAIGSEGGVHGKEATYFEEQTNGGIEFQQTRRGCACLTASCRGFTWRYDGSGNSDL
jgi:hypothetical protein